MATSKSTRRTASQGHGGWRPGAGRPKLSPEKKASVTITIQVSPAEADAIQRGQEYYGYRVRSPYLRHIIIKHLEEEGLR